ncbi:SDR family NAD(P)-dependent oxidoreductase [Tautonia sociabilis]|uniref:SDR family oxidoreductase n=1 Tax=Tautonia sociabilis TaxID=2080755 RepID=A0A432MN51_9BACT|nr:SDR family NAD(P)-dependent oxidoreductase [Tautonia sociabilis]RUL88536.1 SDR family oxidoreductase [Tautonia sociabilis]
MILSGSAVLITGGRRVGGDLARLLAGRGARLAMTYRTSEETIRRTLQECKDRGAADVLAVAADLADPAQAERAVGEVLARFGRIDALVNMASVYERTPFRDLTPEHLERMLATNLIAPYYAAVAVGKAMLDQEPIAGGSGLSGKIVQVGDWSTARPRRGQLPYITAKGGLTTMTLALAKELAPRVAVNLVQPGTIEPPPELDESERRAIARATPLGRIGTAQDVNGLILYLLEGTDFATGGCYRVDGGRFLGVDDEPT